MVPLVYSRDDARRAAQYCKYPPGGLRSVAYPVRAVYRKGVGVGALASYLRDANQETEVGTHPRARTSAPEPPQGGPMVACGWPP